MPDFVRDALLEHWLIETYLSRAPHQQNDCIGWITRAKRHATKEMRLTQMLLVESGDKYKNMDYRPKQRG
jgi:hypothetical protein